MLHCFLAALGRSAWGGICFQFPGRAAIKVVHSQKAEVEPVDELGCALLGFRQPLGLGVGGLLFAFVGLFVQLCLFGALLFGRQRLAILASQPLEALAVKRNAFMR